LKIIKHLAWVLLLFVSYSCGVYSFSGASISPDIKTISIGNFYNDTPGGPANLSQTFTNKMRDYFLQNTNLAIVTENGDLQFEGRITGYDIRPAAPTASQEEDGVDFSSITRLTIRVQASYINTQDDTFNFDQTFSFFSNFNSNQNSFTEVEDQLIEEITDQIVIDIFNASVANW